MWSTMTSPVGTLRLVAADGALTAVEFVDETAAPARPRSSTEVARRRSAERPRGERADDDPVLREAAAQLTAYFRGEQQHFDLPLEPEGSVFQLRVWDQLRSIPYGETATYGEIARRLGLSGAASRAVGLANGRNPLPIVVPCHRVVGAGGALTGYAGGVDRKRTLLDLEQGALFPA